MHLDLRVGRDEDTVRLAVEPFVDGRRLLPGRLRGVDPDWLLPPLSGALLPSGAGRSALVGTCCTVGCGSFHVRVRRDGQRVLWEPDHRARDTTTPDILDFGLLAYLDAVDRAVADPQLQERGRRLARATELELARHDEIDDRPGAREVTLPMAWQNGAGHVALRSEDGLHQVPLTDLPDDDARAVQVLTMLALDPFRLPPASY